MERQNIGGVDVLHWNPRRPIGLRPRSIPVDEVDAARPASGQLWRSARPSRRASDSEGGRLETEQGAATA